MSERCHSPAHYVLGHFKDLLLATACHPAMLYYLGQLGNPSLPGKF